VWARDEYDDSTKVSDATGTCLSFWVVEDLLDLQASSKTLTASACLLSSAS